MRHVAVVPHTHWDREWYSPFQTFRLRLVDLLDDLLPRLEGDPSYAHFLLDGQMAVIDDYLAVRPEAESSIRRLAVAGPAVDGPWYILMDEFLVSGETIVRDLQWASSGRRRSAAPCRRLPPDMFGHVAVAPAPPQFGFDHAVVWRGIPEAMSTTAFWWEAPTVRRVRAEFLPRATGTAPAPRGRQGVRGDVSHDSKRTTVLAGDRANGPCSG